MRLVLIVAIRMYRRSLGRIRRTARCLFRESCSCYVERVAEEQGFIAACQAMSLRLRSCRPGYAIIVTDAAISAECRGGHRIEWAELSDTLQNEAVFLAQYARNTA